MKTATDPVMMARRFQALADPTRLEIIQLLGHGEFCVCDLQSALGAAQSRLSFHLRKLKEAGLVADRKDGRWVHYSLTSDALDDLGSWLGDAARGDLTEPPSDLCCG